MRNAAVRWTVLGLALGALVWADVAEARRTYNPWSEARRDLERALHSIEGIASQRARRARGAIGETLKVVRKGEAQWTPPEGGGNARQACAAEVVRRLKVHEGDVRVQRSGGNAEEGIQIDWWAYKSDQREKSGFCIVQRGGEVSRFKRN